MQQQNGPALPLGHASNFAQRRANEFPCRGKARGVERHRRAVRTVASARDRARRQHPGCQDASAEEEKVSPAVHGVHFASDESRPLSKSLAISNINISTARTSRAWPTTDTF